MSEEEKAEQVEETTTPVLNGDGTPEVTPETVVVEPPEPGSIEYTKAVEEKIGKVKSQQYKAEAERDLWKQKADQLEAQGQTPAIPQTPVSTFAEPEPVDTAYDDYNQYIKDLASWQVKKEQAIFIANSAQQEAVTRQQKIESNFKGKVESSEILTDHPDFYEKIRFVNLVPHVQEAVLTSDIGPTLAFHLANNPEVMRDLNTDTPLVAARKLGAIEARLSGKVDKKTVSTTPSPITPVSTSTSAITEDNPKDINDWMKKRKERELAKLTKQLNGEP